MAEQKFVVFSLAQERFALRIESVERILDELPVTPLPRTSKVLLGVFELRGETIPTMDLRRRFEMEDRKDSGNYVVVQTGTGRIAVRVDRVEGIVASDETLVEPVQDSLANDADPFIDGILREDNLLTVVLNPEEIVPKTLRKKVESANKVAA